MPTVRVSEVSSLPHEPILEAARDFTPRRADLWPDVHLEHMVVHDRGETWADVTAVEVPEGAIWPPNPTVKPAKGSDPPRPGTRT